MWQFRDGDNIKFQSTLPRGERLGLGVDDLTNYLFQSTLPRGERLPKPFKTVLMFHFNPRSREGSDWRETILPPLFSISIHAPARGATTIRRTSTTPHIFQSTLPRGERHDRLPDGCLVRMISIHAPARGATPALYMLPESPEFQSTLPRGERLQFYLKFTLCF